MESNSKSKRPLPQEEVDSEADNVAKKKQKASKEPNDTADPTEKKVAADEVVAMKEEGENGGGADDEALDKGEDGIDEEEDEEEEDDDDVEQPPLVLPKISDEETQWNQMFFKLMLYKANHGNLNVKPKDDEHSDLHSWIQQQRRDYKKFQKKPGESSMTEDRVKVLESIRFSLTTRGDSHWYRNYQRLKKFKSEHGHVLVPRISEAPGLGDWVVNQRLQNKEMMQGKQTPLTNQRKELLDELGFVWQVRYRPEWQTRYQELVEYKKSTGHTKVPQHYANNRALGKWVAKQREQYKLLKLGKHSFMTPDRVEKLDEIGFVWSLKGEVVEA